MPVDVECGGPLGAGDETTHFGPPHSARDAPIMPAHGDPQGRLDQPSGSNPTLGARV